MTTLNEALNSDPLYADTQRGIRLDGQSYDSICAFTKPGKDCYRRNELSYAQSIEDIVVPYHAQNAL